MNIKDVEIKILDSNCIDQFMQLIRLFEDVFEMKNFKVPETEYLKKILADEWNFHVIVALKDNVVVGGLTVYTIQQYYSERPLAYIYDLAVKSEMQRMGIGSILIEFTKSYFAVLGYEEVFVQADRVDKHALDFYRKTNPSAEEDVLHFYYKL